MKRSITIRALQDNAEAIRAMGAQSLYLFGSVSRDAASDESDVDLFIDYDPESGFSLLDLVGIKQFLEDRLDAEVDITTRDSLHPLLRERVERTAVKVF